MATLAEALLFGWQTEQAGDLNQAERVYREVLRVDPANAAALHRLATVCLKQGRPADAAAYYRQSLRIEAGNPDGHSSLGIALASLGKPAEAVAAFREAASLRPNDAHVLSNLGNALRESGRLEDAVTCLRSALRLAPSSTGALHNLGLALEAQEKLEDAAAAFRQLVASQPGNAEAHACLGRTAAKLRKSEEALSSLQQALLLDPTHAEARNSMGVLLAELGKLEQAVDHFRQALKPRPEFPEAWNNLGNALYNLGRFPEAASAIEEALRLKPDYAEAHLNLGNILGHSANEQRDLARATACWSRALEFRPDYAEAANSLGNVQLQQGELDEALTWYRRALKFKPEYTLAHSNLLCALQYRSGVSLAELTEAHAEYDRLHAAKLLPAASTHENSPDPDRPLRLGFISPDLGRHPVGYFLVRVLENLDRRQCETICYSERRQKDELTRRIEAAATGWRDVYELRDRQLAEQVRADRIDILVDLTGHTAGNRLLVFARKPAPIQMTWMGYVGTTGLSAMDYLIADRWQIPAGAERHFREKLLRLPDGYICFDPPAEAPKVKALPALRLGHVTFGSFNNPVKMTPAVIALWAKILKRVPRSRLVLKYRCFDDEDSRRRFERLFAEQGVARDRFDLEGWGSHAQLLETYNRVDLALDTFPYSGGLTTCEALWMGVPVITCPGETFAGRHSLSHLSNIGLTETIAKDMSHYVELAVELANNLGRLSKLRTELRERTAKSPLCDGPRFAANLVEALRAVWQEYCTRVPPAASLAYSHNSRAVVLASQGRLEEAVAAFRQAAAICPNDAHLHSNLGNALRDLGRSEEAVACLQKAIRLDPAGAIAHQNLGLALEANGNLPAAVAAFGRALELKPDFVAAHSNLLCAMQYRPGIGLPELAEAHAEFDRRHAVPLRPARRSQVHSWDPARPLRLGFVSPDLGRHPVGFFLVKVLENLDRQQCRTVCYSDRRFGDDLAIRLRQAAADWREVSEHSDDRLAELIRADQIDILFDLAGHTGRNRLLVFARKPAPVQMTWMGYAGTTGLSAMDYLVADRWEVPEGMEKHFREKVLRLPDGYVCYAPPDWAPAVGPLPALQSGHVTFGSFNNPAKINPAVAKVWAEVLRRVPGSRLMLKFKNFDDPAGRGHFQRLFAEHGVDAGRLDLLGWSAPEKLFETYNRIDLALDTFPYSGGLTTCEALWMGVPVITCPGETFAGRHSLSHLSNIGLTETIAKDMSHYVELAVELANDLGRLSNWRTELRERMGKSPLCDGPRFAANLLGALRAAWQERCARTPQDAMEAQVSNKRGAALASQGRLEEAIAAFRQAVELDPDDAHLHSNLGNALREFGRPDEALACLETAVRLDPFSVAANQNLGLAFEAQGRFQEARSCYRKVANLQPQSAEVHAHLGRAAARMGHAEEALRDLQQALVRDPHHAEAHNIIGVLLAEERRLPEAVAHFRQALQSRPDLLEACNNLGNALKNQGELDEAIACFRRVVDLKPDYMTAHSNLLYALHYHPDVGLAELAREHAEFDRRHATPLMRRHAAPTAGRERPANTSRTLRLGFVSPDLGRHPVGFLFIGALENLDRKRCETTCYSDRRNADELTARFRKAATHWREVAGLSHDRLADLIRADGLDILVDLAGHTGNNRLAVFARKPAPIQVTWMGYEGTTGLAAMDYLIADRWEIPAEFERHYREKILRLPDGYVCYEPPAWAPAVQALPALKKGYLTFGSFNNPAKIHPTVVKSWAEILRRVPRSRLVLKLRSAEDPGSRARYERMFAEHGIGTDRLDLSGWTSHVQLLGEYQGIDLALDTFPFSGGLTTCESLWMGVPVITCPGETFASRHSLSHLSNVGLTETIARDLGHYVELAVELASDLPWLVTWRAELRERMARSPLCDSNRFAENLLNALSALPENWER
jgi:predicted O-linked N-acetylglucosamine transferase (SPINDLY family)